MDSLQTTMDSLQTTMDSLQTHYGLTTDHYGLTTDHYGLTTDYYGLSTNHYGLATGHYCSTMQLIEVAMGTAELQEPQRTTAVPCSKPGFADVKCANSGLWVMCLLAAHILSGGFSRFKDLVSN
jgi:hypothetical protein